jgi:hypothetical protein
MPKRPTLIAWEMLLLFASVLVFRSTWILLDRWDWANGTGGLIALLIIGCALCVVAFRGINQS